MLDAMNIRHERFAELVASGVPAVRAYTEAGYSNKGKNAEANATRLMANDGVKSRIAEFRAKSSAKLELKREDLARHLMNAVRTPIGEVDENSPLAQEYTIDREGRKRVKMIGKIECARLLCELMGWKEPEKHEVHAGPSNLDAIRERAKSIVSALDRSGRNRDESR